MAHQFAIKSYFDVDELIFREEKLSLTMPIGAFLLGKEFAAYGGGSGGGAAASANGNTNQNMTGSASTSANTAATSFTAASSSSSDSFDAQQQQQHVPRDTKLTIPLWAAYALRMQGYAAVAVPDMCTYSSFREFRQDPMGPNLRIKSPYFFDFAAEAASIAPPQEGPRLRNRLVELHRKRYPSVLLVGNKKGFDLSEARDALPNSERRIVDKTLECAASEKAWYAEQKL